MKFEKRTLYLWVSTLALFLAACAPQGVEMPVTGETPSPGLPPQAVLDAQQWLAAQLGATAEQIQIIEVEQAEWTDSCLGLGRANESCLQAITPGWRAILEVSGQRHEVRTDETGSVIRLALPEGVSAGLENTLWSLISFSSAGAEQPLVEMSTITLILAAGQAGGTGGCNAYGGTYQVDGNSIAFEEIIRTEMACADEGVTEQEQRYFQALESASSYELAENVLRITYDDGAGVLVFQAPPSAGP